MSFPASFDATPRHGLLYSQGFGRCTSNAHIHNDMKEAWILEINNEGPLNLSEDVAKPNTKGARECEHDTDLNDELEEEAVTEAARTKKICEIGGITFNSDDDNAVLASFITRRVRANLRVAVSKVGLDYLTGFCELGLNTRDKLHKCGSIQQQRAKRVMCNEEEETVFHLFFSCNRVWEVRGRCCKVGNWNGFGQNRQRSALNHGFRLHDQSD
ncbi:hypothetical protein PIB30_092378 [Stylosanthes scabra]|uniref:Reverse transcriptase zinc-binding domain-containing protein n=1 Tax=Stylosanthes scabra TaxID=79078 RepID=A0ABU6ZTI1_9FABA|nr:hypothetical protein [Stylosanthes scabra]